MSLVQDILKEIQFFGAKPTLDSIEKIDSPNMRAKYRRAFEEAFNLLRKSDYRYKLMDLPETEKNREKRDE